MEYRTPLSNNHLTTEGQARSQYNNQHLYRRGLQSPSSTSHQREQTTTKHNHLYRRGIQTNTTPINLYQRGIQQDKEGLQLRGSTTSNTLFFSFPQKQDPKQIRIEDIAQVWKSRCFWKQATKKNYLGNLLQMIEIKDQIKIPKTQFSLIFQNP